MFNWLLSVVNSGVIDNISSGNGASDFSNPQPSNTITNSVNSDFDPTILLFSILAVIIFIMILKILNMNSQLKELEEKINKKSPDLSEEDQQKEE